MLEIDGANVDLACNGIEAIEKAMTKHYDVILMDIQMPQLDGLEATKTLRYRGYTRPIFALTAHAMKEDKEKSILAGCDGHLSKPIKREVLVSAIEQYREFVLH